MSKKLTLLLGAIFMAAALGGCQLAREGEAAAGGGAPDRLIGVFITFEHLGIDEPLHAIAKKETLEGTAATVFEFPGARGLPYFSALVAENGGAETYSTTVGSPEIMDGSAHLAISDEGKEVTLVGKIYTLENLTLFINPVYQDAAGRVSVKPGGSGYFIGCGSCTVTLSEETKTTQNQADRSEVEKYSAKIELTVEKVETPVEVVFKEMNAQDEVVNTTLILPGAIPESLRWQPDCAYVLVIARSGGFDGEITRTIVDIDEQYYTYKYAGENGCLVGKAIVIGN